VRATQAPGYRNVEFLITTGPGPVPSLDGRNIVFGKVVQGLETVAALSGVPTFSPNASARQMNQFAMFVGDER
jgi:peptidyl-prolyl cis-trans isomerase B (cyclophilin B)